MKIAIIPARGGSKRIPYKNIKLFKGVPIISRTIKELKKSNIFDLIIVSTDSLKIAKIAKKNGVEVPFLRPKKISDDYTDTQTVIKHAIKWLKDKNIYTKYICCVYPTSVFLNKKDLLNGYKKIKASKWDFVLQRQNLKSLHTTHLKKKSGSIKMLFSKIFSKKITSNQ